jgi:signal transduction histidine kinase
MRNWLSTPDAVGERRIFEVMFRAALQGAREGLVGGTLLASFVAWMFWDQRANPLAQAWFATMAVLVGVRAVMHYRWGREPDAALGPRHGRALVVGYLAAGTLWGLAGWVFHADAAEWTRYALLTGQYTMLVMSVVALSWYLPAFVSFATPAALLIPFPWLAQSPEVGVVVALGTLFNYLVWLGFARRLARTQAESLRMRFERQGLMDRLARHARAMEIAHQAMTRFLGSASHDLRQPLHGMALMLSTARQGGGGLPLASVSTLETMVRSFEEILESFIEAARIDAARIDVARQVHLQPCDVQAQVDQAVEELAPLAAEAQLTLRVWRHPGLVMSNPGALLRIARNLLSNALKYTPAGGVLVALRCHAGLLRLEVWDTGPGIAAEDLGRIFEPFERVGSREEPGAGLGLAVVKQLCDTLGHRVEVQSRPGRGSVFRVTLGPVLAGSAVREPAEPALPQPRGVLLLVRDEALARTLTALLDQWELPWRHVDDPAVWAAAIRADGTWLALLEAEAADSEDLRHVLAQAGAPCIWLAHASTRAAALEPAESAVQVPLPLQPVALRAALNRMARLAAGAASPRSPASVN